MKHIKHYLVGLRIIKKNNIEMHKKQSNNFLIIKFWTDIDKASEGVESDDDDENR